MLLQKVLLDSLRLNVSNGECSQAPPLCRPLGNFCDSGHVVMISSNIYLTLSGLPFMYNG